MNSSRACSYGREPKLSTITRTSTPSSSLRPRRAAIAVPTVPSRQPNMRMCTDDRAASTSAKIRGKKLAPSTSGSIVAAVDHANGSAASCGRVPPRATNASVAACAPAGVTASAGGGQLGRLVIPSTCRYTTTKAASATPAIAPAAALRSAPAPRCRLARRGSSFT